MVALENIQSMLLTALENMHYGQDKRTKKENSADLE